ncbi:hypothetical protein [Streptomyces sp. NBC_00576]|uniref:hypothetical protein n=1 Tax=Streptomyces sp. NBC_00576 TaxID=2903665 RepID=UPI002E80246E|nr:hypothetical protein [Streptomyces sp. NBC_00576]WUB75404.1 hypothetical protein OG734_38065 [Streptomyces sp. NBC_00576]
MGADGNRLPATLELLTVIRCPSSAAALVAVGDARVSGAIEPGSLVVATAHGLKGM